MASKTSRGALIALAVGAGGLAAASAAGAAVSIPTYLVNQPAITGASAITPESATVSGVIDTGGTQGSTFTLPANSTLIWGGISSITLTTTTAPATEYVDGIPTNDSTSPFNVIGGQLNNGGFDNSSSVVFEYDPVSDYDSNGDSPGPDTSFATQLNVPTTSGLSPVSTTIGAYPASAADKSGQTPLTPGTKYYYWIVQQAGVTQGAEDVNTFNTTTVTTNPTYVCYPYSYIAASQYASFTTTGTIVGGGLTEPQIQGPCTYYFGSSNNYDQSPNGTFTTPALGTVSFGAKATISGKKAVLAVTNKSVMPATGVVTLSVGGASVGTGHFSVAAKGKGTVSVTLNGKGLSATGKSAKVTATISTDQTLGTKAVTL